MTTPVAAGLSAGWDLRAKPPLLTRRFGFADYAATRAFLDRLAALSESHGLYPDLNFGRTHVSLSLAADEALGEREFAFARAVQATFGDAAA